MPLLARGHHTRGHASDARTATAYELKQLFLPPPEWLRNHINKNTEVRATELREARVVSLVCLSRRNLSKIDK